ncbi:hypothetical protein DUNSADRAFT_15855 [Dunaliella salina]|uniref:Tetratricopeptide repeat protein 26 n=1 Tax=Dunaliella salina TaxID=3046 RepID=A0ABQ7G4S1_DUNSA|nr:hypothetical protein DUNSADRAFT_15855 [Dunaliella salina]|eukprot:KAF5829604.1 hypothetical protein DUNSADRAFT_15855 [Dunaliella salina]
MIPSKSRVKPERSGGTPQDGKRKESHIPDLETFLQRRDYAGACALLQFKRHANRNDTKTMEWLAYCHFHYGEHDKALNLYKDLMQFQDYDPMVHIYAAACYFYMGLYKEAEEAAEQGPRCGLQTRVLFHVAYKQNDEARLLQYHQQLSDTIEDQLSLASIHYQRGHFQEATDIYKRLLLENREFLALNVYVALCYCKLDYYDVSMEILQVYLDKFKDTEAELKQLSELSGGTYLENDLLRHNLVVFRGGENALQYLPPLGDVPPEARLNLVIHHLRHNDIGEALSLVKDLEPTSPQEYILKAVVHASIGQSRGSADNLKTAQQYFQLVGASSSECDTIPGRQCMASCFYLLKQFEDVLVFLQSIKSYFPNDDDFNWNYGITKVGVLLPVVACALLHQKRATKAGVGAVPQNGDKL